jgi:hypothetical protein
MMIIMMMMMMIIMIMLEMMMTIRDEHCHHHCKSCCNRQQDSYSYRWCYSMTRPKTFSSVWTRQVARMHISIDRLQYLKEDYNM